MRLASFCVTLLLACCATSTDPSWVRELGGGDKHSVDLLHLLRTPAAAPAQRRPPAALGSQLSGGASTLLAHVAKEQGGILYGLDVTSGGAERWSAHVSDSVIFYQDGTLRFSAASAFATDGNATVALDAATGARRWRFDGRNGAPLVTALSMDEKTIYVLCGDWMQPGAAPSLFALDVDSGVQRWMASPPAEPRVAGGLRSAAGGSVVLLFGQGMGANALLALDADSGATTEWSLGMGDETLAAVTPLTLSAQDSGKTLYVCVYRVLAGGAGAQQTLHALDAASGQEHWRVDTDGGVSELQLLQQEATLIFLDLDASANAATINLVETASGASLRRWQLPEYDFLLVGAAEDSSLAFFQRTSSDQNRSSCVSAIDLSAYSFTTLVLLYMRSCSLLSVTFRSIWIGI